MLLRINEAFAHCAGNGCLYSTSRALFFVIDPAAGKSQLHLADEPPHFPCFAVKNNTNAEVHVLCIDDCIFFAGDGKKCDFAVFDDSVFCFVEMKKGLGSNRNKKKRDGAEQLKTTIRDFLQRIKFDDYRVEACLNVGYRETSPRISASNQNLRKQFMDEFGIDLFEGSEICFPC